MASAPGSNVVHFLFCGASKSGSRYANKRSVLRLWQQTWPTMTRIPVAFRAELDYVLDRRGRSSPATVCWNNRSGGCPIARLSIRIGEGATVQESEQTGKKARPDRARRRSCLVPLDQPRLRFYRVHQHRTPMSAGCVSRQVARARHSRAQLEHGSATFGGLSAPRDPETSFHGNHFHNEKISGAPLSLFKMAAIHLPISSADARRRRNLSVETSPVRLDFRQEEGTSPESATRSKCQPFSPRGQNTPSCS